MSLDPKRPRIKLDFTTPNTPPVAKERTAKKPPDYTKTPICPYCFQRGIHRTAAQCMHALESQD